jgi:hypothetical protein
VNKDELLHKGTISKMDDKNEKRTKISIEYKGKIQMNDKTTIKVETVKQLVKIKGMERKIRPCRHLTINSKAESTPRKPATAISENCYQPELNTCY